MGAYLFRNIKLASSVSGWIVDGFIVLGQSFDAWRRCTEPAVQIHQILWAEGAGGLFQVKSVEYVVVAGIGIVLQGFVIVPFGIQHFDDVASADFLPRTGSVQCTAARDDGLFECRGGFDIGIDLTKQTAGVDPHVPTNGIQGLIGHRDQ